MPRLDVSFVVNDPMLSDQFSVIRRTDGIGTDGRAAPLTTRFDNLVGVVTNQDPADLMRRDDGQFVPRSIFVASRFAFRGPSLGSLPDIIEWHQVKYEVKQCYSYSRMGRGFYEVVATSLDAVSPSQ